MKVFDEPRFPPCVFCGGSDTPQHKEDILPKWIARPWPKSFIRVKGINSDREFGARGHLGLVVRGPCQRCNNTWMSELESAAKPLLLPMMKGEPTALAPEDQGTIVTWLTKTCMMMDLAASDRARKHFRPRDLARFFADRSVPANTSVYLGAYDMQHVGVKTRDYTMTFDAPGRHLGMGEIAAYSGTIALGRAVLQLFSWHRPEGYLKPLPFTPPLFWESVLTTIWPVGQTYRWPPRVGLADTEFELFANRWTNQAQSARPALVNNLQPTRPSAASMDEK